MKKHFLLLILLGFTLSVISQNDPIINCDDESFTPDEFEGGSTLCMTYGQQTPDLSIGEGTSWPKASDFIDASLVGKKIHITGDFTIDKNFTFKNCTIRITPGKAIFNNYFSLSIDNSKLFACQLLWKGIILGPVSRIKCFNSTIIEDAEGAIQCKNAEFAFIDLTSTTFNRNRIGILVDNQNPYGIYPQITTFLQNKFSCTSPLNGTTDEYSFAGIKSNNLNIITSQNARINQFFDQHYGIFTEGSPTEINGQLFVMNRIKQEGILLHHGVLNITTSNFTNCKNNAIHIIRNQQTRIQGGTIAIDNNILKSSIHNGIKIDEFLPGSNTEITTTVRCSLIWSRFYEKITGIHLQGGLVGAGTFISVSNSNISIDNRGGIGINLPGIFPPSSFTLLQSNNFFIGFDSPFDRSDYPTGIVSVDEKNNLKIVGNHITGIKPWQGANQTVGISISNSMGFGNEITSNLFYGIRFYSFPPNPPVGIGSSGFYFRTGLIMENAMNFRVCENINDHGADNGYIFNHLCLNTDLGYNSNYGSRIGDNISSSGVIFPQFHRGNKWYPKIDQGWMILPFRYANCDNVIGINQNVFTIHTPQSIWDIWRYTYFSEYHPDHDRLSPDANDEFFNPDLNGSLGPGCAALSPEDIKAPDIEIAADNFPYNPSYISGIYDARKYLLTKLLKDTSLISTNTTIRTFYNQNIDATVGQVAKVNKLLNDSYDLDSSLLNTIDTILYAFDTLSDEISEIDSLIELSEEIDTALLEQRSELSLLHRAKQYQLDTLIHNARTSFNDGLDLAISELENVEPDSVYDSNEKEYYGVLLQSLRFHNGKITESEAQLLSEIAENCPSTNGYAVKIARALLPWCQTDSTEFCNDTISLPQGEQTIIYVGEELRKNDVRKIHHLDKFETSLNSPTEKLQYQPTYELYNLSGHQITFSNNLSDFYYDIKISNGIYILITKDYLGNKKVTKFAIIK